MDATLEFLKDRIEHQLRRLDALDTGTGGVVVDFPDELPYGWATVADENARCYGPAVEILENLEDALSGQTIGDPDRYDSFGDHVGFCAAWDALASFGDKPPGSEVWNDFHDFVGGVETEGGLGLIALRTNAGLRYGFAPRGNDYSAFNSTHDYSEMYRRADDAMDRAGQFEAEETARREN